MAGTETKLYVTNFPSSATRQQLQQFFSRFGRVQECAIMWNSYAFVHYATVEEARRALEQSNGAMFLNRKLIVQFSTSRFRPQPKESTTNNSSNEHSKPSHYSHSDMNFDLTGNNINAQVNESNRFYSNEFRPASPPIDQLKINNVKANKSMKNEAERALLTLNGYNWKDRRLIVEWSRASGRRQQQSSISSSSPGTPPRLGSFASDGSTPSSPRSRPTNGQFYGQTPSPHSTNQNRNLIVGHPIYENMEMPPFLDANQFFSSPTSPARPRSNVYQPSDIVTLLESNSSDETSPIKSNNDLYSLTSNPLAPSCSSAAAAGAAALFQENLLSSLFNSFEPFSQMFSNDESKRYHHSSASPLLTTAPDHSHSPMFYGHNVSWH